jgi:hypothetical protein
MVWDKVVVHGVKAKLQQIGAKVAVANGSSKFFFAVHWHFESMLQFATLLHVATTAPRSNYCSTFQPLLHVEKNDLIVAVFIGTKSLPPCPLLTMLSTALAVSAEIGQV